MAGDLPPGKTARKLSRAQVMEILERNCRLYKDENTFVPYLVELALYLLEYEYDWGESGAPPPKFPGSADGGRGSSLAPPRPSAKPGVQIRPAAITPGSRNCPHCGTAIGDELICPSCRNLTR
ncbi:hypothetical protein HY256_03090 [Candidatus Sumerlaeota bacterium]|nr:hypothetical protein [Candidatus Sumerlaeota bacterium]